MAAYVVTWVLFLVVLEVDDKVVSMPVRLRDLTSASAVVLCVDVLLIDKPVFEAVMKTSYSRYFSSVDVFGVDILGVVLKTKLVPVFGLLPVVVVVVVDRSGTLVMGTITSELTLS